MSRGNPLVEIAHGPVRGERYDDVTVWRGLPFAAPPVGRLRFAAPRPVEPWREVREAVRFAPVAPQPRSLLSHLSFSGEPVPRPGAGDDFLGLNVYSPGPGGDPRPVMVFLHGGAFFAGTGSQYDARRLAVEGDLVVVTCNYRLGPLGWMCFKGVAEHPEDFATNLGLRDQLAALEWVRENIAAFGGDPERVTLCGESAGASSAACLLGSPRARGLVQRVIVQSPAVLEANDEDTAAIVAERFLAHLGCRRAEELVSMPLVEVVGPLFTFMAEQASRSPETRLLAPTFGDDMLPRQPLEAVSAGLSEGVPLVVGTNRDEATLFLRSPASIFPVSEDRVRRLLAAKNPDGVEALLAAYPDFPSRRAIGAFLGDVVFHMPAVRLAEAQASHAPVWAYRFDYATALLELTGMGAMHGLELPFVFDQLDSPSAKRLLRGAFKPTARRLGRRMRRRWLAFMHGKSPDDVEARVPWPRYRPEGRRSTVIFARRDRVIDDPNSQRRQAWKRFRAGADG